MTARGRVIITRPQPDADAFAEICRSLDLEPVLSPVMRIEIKQHSLDLSGVDALAFTSANGVRAYVANSNVRDVPVFAVGKVTAAAAQAAGVADIHTAGGDVDSLADHIGAKKSLIRKGLLHIAGEARAGDLVAALRKAGVTASRVSLYEAAAAQALTKPAIDALKDQTTPLWVAFFSPRTAKLFVALAEQAGIAGLLEGAHAACLSHAVEKAAGKGWASTGVAAEYTAESLAALITASLQA